MEDEYFHIYNRGNSKQEIFKDVNDYERFCKLLYISNSVQPFKIRDLSTDVDVYDVVRGNYLVDIEAYCLMPNHFHILMTPRVEKGVSLFMKKLATGYSMYFNQKYNRSGSLFEGKFKSRHADSDEYLKYLFSYINLNPLKLLMPDWKENGFSNINTAFIFLESYQHSSYLDHLPTGRTCGEV